MQQGKINYGLVFLSLLIFNAGPSFSAGNLNPAADISKIKTLREEDLVPKEEEAVVPDVQDVEEEKITLPEEYKQIKINLRKVKVTGATIYTEAQLKKAYEEFLDKEISIDKLWEIAARITSKYRNDGYFLSRAYVPEQEMDVEAKIEIKVYEGGIGEVKIDPKLLKKSYVRKLIEEIEQAKPININLLEQNLLRLNDIPGISLQSVLQKKKSDESEIEEKDSENNDKDSEEKTSKEEKNKEAAEVNLIENNEDNQSQLVFVNQPKKGSTTVRFDNSGSRFLGPQKLLISHEDVYIPNNKTTISYLATTPAKELNYFYFSNYTPVTEKTFFEIYGSYSMAKPGYNLEPREIESYSRIVGFDFIKKIIRTRQKNLEMNAGFEAANSNTNVFSSSLLSKDRVRALKLGFSYDNRIFLGGTSTIDLDIKHGISAFNATEKDYQDASRSETTPNFSKIELKLSHQRTLFKDFGLVLGANAQYSPDSLYSSEEFGYGGSTLGRAFDGSELSGDKGVAAFAEVSYLAIPDYKGMLTVPYVFYDAGKVWNNNLGQEKHSLGASYGGGSKFYYKNLTSNLGVSAPVYRKISTPIYEKEDRFRFIFNVSYNY